MAREYGNKGGSSGSRGGKSAGSGRSGPPRGGAGGRSEGGGRSGARSGAGRSEGGRSRPSEGRSEKPARSYSDKPRTYGDRDARPARDDRDARPAPRGDRDARPAPRGERSDKPARSYGDKPRTYGDRDARPAPRGDRDERPARSYSDRPRKEGGRSGAGADDRADRTPRRYIRDEGDAPRAPRPPRVAGARREYPERKPFKGRFEEAGQDEAPRGRKARIGADSLGPSTTPRVRIQANLWGQHAVKAAWLNPARTISALYTTPEELKLFAPVLEEARAAGIHRPEATLVGREDLDKHLPREAVHQGLAVTAAEPEEVFIQDIINKAKAKPRSLVVILDQVTDPHNVGAIIRSVCALGGDGVVMQRRNAPELTGIVAKASSGAIEHVMVAYETNLSRTIEALQAEGYTVAGLDERGEQTVDSLKGIERLALVLGSEGPGLRHLVKEHCDVLVKIQMSGPIPSLNVSNAAAVALYAAVA